MNQVQFMHFRPDNNESRGGATVAILPADNNKALIAVAYCGPNDVFNKKVGRDISAGRIRAFLEGRPALNDKIQEVVVEDPVKLKTCVGEYLYSEMAKKDLY